MPSIRKILASSALLLCSAAAGAIEARAAAPTVTISAGTVVGTTTQFPGATATNNKFLGIPFAKSPPLRFGLPAAASPWSSPLQATSYKPACLQQVTGPSTAPPHGQSEDCLYVNVFTPAGASPGSNKTVMVWVYGGNLQTGDASLYDGSSFAAKQDVIVVTFGYRLNAFGFSNAPEIPLDQQNVGFYDQRFALNWVQSNIFAFGGDPRNVTLFGQSAGAFSVKNLVAFPPSPQPFRGAIMESPALFILNNGVQSWNSLAAGLGCTGTSNLACVRAADASKVQSVIANMSLGFPPTDDGKTYTTDINSRYTNKQAAQIPLMVGSNGQELSYLPYFLKVPNGPVFDLVDTVFTDLIFQCPVAQFAQATQATNYLTWRYFYNASFPNTEVFPNSGAYHGAEIPEVYGTYPVADATTQEVALSKYMQTAWASFAKNPTAGPGWPEYGSQMNVANLGSNGNGGEVTIPASQIDGICSALAVIGDLTTLLPVLNASATVLGGLENVLQLVF